MFCTNCGNSIGDSDKYCPQCGKANAPGAAGATGYSPARPCFSRAMREKKIAGVCAGISRHLDLDVTVVRVVFLALILFKGLGLWAYLVLWAAMARDDQEPFNQPAAQRF